MLNKLISIYIWKFLSLFLNLFSIFIIVPFLSNNKELYGLYLLCTSLVLFLTYSDFGFIGAGQKFAAEEYTKKNFLKEAEIIGFTSFILLCASILFSLFMFFLSFNPNSLIRNLDSSNLFIASKLYLILGFFTPINILLQRIITNILVIRLKDYISYRIEILFNIIKILSVFYFFKNRYLIIEYFLFIQIISLISALITIIVIRKREKYNFIHLFKNIRFNYNYYNLIKKLALSTMLTTIAWIIYFELDLVYISKFFGPKQVAIYGVAFTFLNFLRTLWNNIYTPFAVPFNQLVANKKYEELKKLFSNIVFYTFPISFIVTLTLFLFTNKFIQLWVGNDYNDTIIILQILISTSGLGFIIQPASFYFVATLKLLSYYYIYKLVDHNFILKSWALILVTFSFLSIIIIPIMTINIFDTVNKSSVELIRLVILIGFYIIISIFTIFMINNKTRESLFSFIKNLKYKSLLKNA